MCQVPFHIGFPIRSAFLFFRWTRLDPPVSPMVRQMSAVTCPLTPAAIQSDPVRQIRWMVDGGPTFHLSGGLDGNEQAVLRGERD